MVARRLVKAPEKRGGGTPALGVRQKTLSAPKNMLGAHHQASPDKNGGYALRLGKFDS